jgi:hypothetical protein
LAITVFVVVSLLGTIKGSKLGSAIRASNSVEARTANGARRKGEK